MSEGNYTDSCCLPTIIHNKAVIIIIIIIQDIGKQQVFKEKERDGDGGKEYNEESKEFLIGRGE